MIVTFVLKMTGRPLLFRCVEYVSMLGNSQAKYRNFDGWGPAMALVVPLRVLRPREEFVSAVASPPYDVLSRDEAVIMASGNTLSFLRVEKSEIDLPQGIDMTDDRVFQTARDNLQRLMNQGVLIQEEAPRFYIYSQQMGDYVQYGITAGISIAEYEAGRIKKHEQTRPDKEMERTRHIAAAHAQTGLVFVIYRGLPVIDDMVAMIVRERPLYDFTADDGIIHRVWALHDERDIAFLQEAFAKIEPLYIADGHHRAAAAAAVCGMKKKQNPAGRGDEPYHFIMATLFPDNQLRILDYNRAARHLNGLTQDEFLRKIKIKFHITPDFTQRKPTAMHTFGMYLRGQWFRLEAKRDVLDCADSMHLLDVAILQDHLLEPVLGIHDPRTDHGIDFIGGVRGMDELEKMVDSGDYAVAFSLYPTTLTQLMDVADAGLIMPPKSTWFEPKLRSGIFVHRID
jgi:uncharacterized protein (DUF1015 family)